ncbi:heavy-metal-associated domain-containing protein [Corynebacterium sp. ES2794-CONJ1]|uniref:heavy-metal-associated domain-containing protein n=1 Tax=unclassified Corynebacterium TaxID=2624378 RepID=UPI002168F194|nr:MULTISPECIES: heavy-metal-associated domain-containing protein [unclassified Corynebacterium]MCS4490501.1 heavy-metal-associated domain-containing protein [Corynebacterium sp. ES2775-CONJ]MCS4492281.1 heavy-metal-associated domain-containing protein [Corynebacterium sp. ES2715-CONJ3]MCS4532235.1 heavy-metal-associated domain-containing protein [Corynebacterium sp. ES2730-CONJ]MCU9519800.1 heavy-metal-associated domain-containing protein [Corynebacterium sp. ES2794-CONJ1]
MVKNYYVSGMTCSHCVASVTEEIDEIPGTEGVEVDLETGRVCVTGQGFSDEEVAAAITEAGYTLKES